MKAGILYKNLVEKLHYPTSLEERKAIIRVLLEDVAQIRQNMILLDAETSKNIEDFQTHLEQLNAGVPIQYVVGFTHFFNLKIAVNPAVLIPRPETEELVHLVVKKGTHQHILDLCTGSGCIALALAHSFPSASVSGWDISKEAIQLAKTNSENLNLKVNFEQKDVLNLGKSPQKWDLMISNPPYVKESEKTEMAAHVLNHEPHLALFVQDNDPLVFYRSIAAFAQEHLSPKGLLALELNAALSLEAKQLFEAFGFKKLNPIKDLFGKDRFLFIENH